MNKRDLDIIKKGVSNWEMYRNSTILVTGATGRLGWYIVDTFVDTNILYNLNLRIVCLARSQEKANDVFGNLSEYPCVSYIFQDVNTPINYEHNVDYIFTLQVLQHH